ncbi:MAG TPA: type IV pilus biogenesis/stability protein PilW [Methylotenera sp.]|nr:type IV pilus biogenesis/stability protein PilW [Methylotenera sp.]
MNSTLSEKSLIPSMLSNSADKSFRVILLICLFGFVMAGCASQQQNTKDKENLKARARAHTDLGAAYYQQKQLEIALEEFTEASRIDPDFALAYNGLGLVYAALGQDDIAEKNFKKSVQLEPTNSESHNNYGSFLCGRNRIDESIKEFLAAVKNPLYSTPAMAYTNAGICSLRKKDNVNAEAFFQKALQIEPLSATAAYQLAALQFKRNDAVGAKKTLQNLMLAQPGPEMLWLAIQIERVLGAKDAEASYALQLRRQYPDSEQARLLQNGK